MTWNTQNKPSCIWPVERMIAQRSTSQLGRDARAPYRFGYLCRAVNRSNSAASRRSSSSTTPISVEQRPSLLARDSYGGMGFVVEPDLHLWSERAKVAEVRGGTADVGSGWLQRELELDHV
jgi:hypothetical protein